MQLIASFTLIPLGESGPLSPIIAEVVDLIEARGLNYTLHATATDLEGEWSEVMAAVEEAHQRVHRLGIQRIQTQLTLSTRSDKPQGLRQRIESVAAARGARDG